MNNLSKSQAIIEKLAKKYDKKLFSYDKRFSGTVLVQSVHSLTSYIFANAFAVKKDGFIIIFSEHDGYHIFYEASYRVGAFGERLKVKDAEF